MAYFPETNIVDSLGNGIEVGAFGALKVAEALPQISLTFDRPLNTVREVTTTGTVAAQYNRSLLRVGGAVGTHTIETREVLRYRTAQTIETYFTASFLGTPGVGEDALIGLFDAEDGVFVGYKGANFVVGYRNINANGTASEPDVTQVVDMSNFTLTNIHRFRIRFGYLGVGNISFEIKTATEWVHLHTFETDASLAGRTHIGSVYLPMRAEVTSTTGTTEILSGSWGAATYGPDSGQQELGFYSSGQREVTASATHQPIVAYKSKTSFGGYTNRVKSQLLTAEFATNHEGLYKVEVFQYAPAGIVGGAWVDINANSLLQVNDTFTGPLPAGQSVFATTIAVGSQGTGLGSSSLDFLKLKIRANPGDEFGIYLRQVVAGTAGTLVTWDISYVDLF